MDDQQIIRLFNERSEEAIAATKEKYGNILGKIARNVLGNSDDAEECVNDAYLALWNSIPPQSPDPLGAYACKVAKNISLKKFRHNSAEKRNTYYEFPRWATGPWRTMRRRRNSCITVRKMGHPLRT